MTRIPDDEKIFTCDQCGKTMYFPMMCDKHSGANKVNFNISQLTVAVCSNCCDCKEDN